MSVPLWLDLRDTRALRVLSGAGTVKLGRGVCGDKGSA